MLPVTDKDFHQEIEKYKGISIVDFWAEWCGPCKVSLPIVKEVSDTIEARVKVMSMNIDECPETPARLGAPGLVLWPVTVLEFRAVTRSSFTKD